MMEAINGIHDLNNVYLDTAMVMDATVLHIVFDSIGPGRLLFGTDLPIAAMRGRRVAVMDHWVDLVLEGYAPSAFRVPSDNMRATFMVYEIVTAIAQAAHTVGLGAEMLQAVYYDNGLSLLEHVMGGDQLTAIRRRWSSCAA
jgi:predicted TIM-barrel fold metal-dependent hydrolase